jgi:outer membrane protein assembly factor BamB
MRKRHPIDRQKGITDNTSAVGGRTVYVGSDDGNVYALSAADGTEQWRFETPSSVRTSPAVIGGSIDEEGVSNGTTDRSVYVANIDGIVYALMASDGTEQWQFETDSWVRSSPAVADQSVYLGDDDGTVFALSATDGTEQWRYENDARVRSSPAVVDGSVYVGDDDGTVIALSTADGTEQWGSKPRVASGRHRLWFSGPSKTGVRRIHPTLAPSTSAVTTATCTPCRPRHWTVNGWRRARAGI